MTAARVPCCEDGHHEAFRAASYADWTALPYVGCQWYPSELDTHEDLHDLRNCPRCNSTLSRVVTSRVRPWSESRSFGPNRIAADLDEVLP